MWLLELVRLRVALEVGEQLGVVRELGHPLDGEARVLHAPRDVLVVSDAYAADRPLSFS